MRILVHAGMPKTGSSSIQHYLATERGRLADGGVIYPDFGHRTHWMLTAAFGDGEAAQHNRALRRIADGKAPRSVDDFLDSLGELIRGVGDDQLLILSDEGMGQASRAKRLVRFLRSARPEAEIMLIAYVRDPQSHFPSAVQQQLKSEADNTLFPWIWLSPHCVEGLALKLTIAAEVTLRAFSPATMPGGDVVEDFRATVERHTGFALPENRDTIPRNISHTAAGCAVIALRDLIPGFPAEHRKCLLRAVRAADEDVPTGKPVLPAGFRQMIAANNAAGWNLLVDLTEHDAVLRRRLRMQPEAMPAGADRANSALWVLGGLRADYVAALLERLRSWPRQPDGRTIANWLVDAAARGHEINAAAARPG